MYRVATLTTVTEIINAIVHQLSIDIKFTRHLHRHHRHHHHHRRLLRLQLLQPWPS